MRNKYLLGPALSVCLLATGCRSPETAVVGKWTVVDIKSASNPMIADRLSSQPSKLVLEIKPDRHFVFMMESGIWKLDGSKLILTVTELNGQSIGDEQKQIHDLMAKSSASMSSKVLTDDGIQVATLAEGNNTLQLPIKAGPFGDVNFVFKKN